MYNVLKILNKIKKYVIYIIIFKSCHQYFIIIFHNKKLLMNVIHIIISYNICIYLNLGHIIKKVFINK